MNKSSLKNQKGMPSFKINYFLGVLILLLISISVQSVNPVSFTDVGPKPIIEIYVTGFDETDYMLDLLADEKTYPMFNDEYFVEEGYELLKDHPIYLYEEAGWKAVHIRGCLLFGSLKGTLNTQTNTMIHHFFYFGVPNRFKIIVERSDGELIISDAVDNPFFYSAVHFDMAKNTIRIVELKDEYEADRAIFNQEIEEMNQQIKETDDKTSYRELESFSFTEWLSISLSNQLDRIISFGMGGLILRILMTILIEWMVAWLFKIKAFKMIVIVNIMTQLALNSLLLMTSVFTPFLSYFIFEGLVVFLEFAIYAMTLKAYSIKHILIYSVIANLTTAVLGLIIMI